MGEEAVDGGGPRREFARLFSKELRNTIFEGPPNKGVIKHDSVGLQVCHTYITELCTECKVLYFKYRRRNFILLGNLWQLLLFSVAVVFPSWRHLSILTSVVLLSRVL